jgi:hypothetical protein
MACITRAELLSLTETEYLMLVEGCDSELEQDVLLFIEEILEIECIELPDELIPNRLL